MDDDRSIHTRDPSLELAVGTVFFSLDGRVTDANEAFETISGYTLEELRGTDWKAMTHPERAWLARRDAEELATRGWIAPYEREHIRKDGSRWRGLFAPVRLSGNGHRSECIAFVIDISAATRAQTALRASEARLASELAAARLLQQISMKLIPEQRPEMLHADIIDAAMALMRSDAASIQLLDPAGERLVLLASRNFHPESHAYWESVGADHASACAQLFRSRARVLIEDVEANDILAGSGDLEAYRRSGLRAVQSTPLVSRSARWIGVISTHWRTPRRLSDADFRLFDVLARQLADLMDRSLTNTALRQSEARYRTLVENIREYWILLVDPAGIITQWVAGAERVMGYAPEEVVGKHVSLLYTAEDIAAGAPERELAEAATTGQLERETWRVRKGDARFWADEIVTANRTADGMLSGFTKMGRDLTDRRLAYEMRERVAAAASRDILRRALYAAEEAERRRLSRDLHDQLGQNLTAFALGLADARRRIGAGESVDARLAQLEDLSRVMQRDARSLALELRPPELDDVGLESAVETYVAEWSARYGIAVDLVVGGLPAESRLSHEVASAVYRIVQESLTNVAKHSGASQVSVIVDRPNGDVRVVVEDDGRGFEPEVVAARSAGERGLGLAGMRERAALAGGTAVIETKPGFGTTIFVRLPVGTENQYDADESASPV